MTAGLPLSRPEALPTDGLTDHQSKPDLAGERPDGPASPGGPGRRASLTDQPERNRAVLQATRPGPRPFRPRVRAASSNL